MISSADTSINSNAGGTRAKMRTVGGISGTLGLTVRLTSSAVTQLRPTRTDENCMCRPASCCTLAHATATLLVRPLRVDCDWSAENHRWLIRRLDGCKVVRWLHTLDLQRSGFPRFTRPLRYL